MLAHDAKCEQSEKTRREPSETRPRGKGVVSQGDNETDKERSRHQRLRLEQHGSQL
jgi:hypothetical protein